MHTTQTPRPGTVGVVGAGTLGVGWALVHARAGARVKLHDSDPARLSVARDEIAARLEDLTAFGLLDEPPAKVAARVVTVAGLEECVHDVALVHENVPEDLRLKRRLFEQLDAAAPPDAVLASSTSAIVTSDIARDLSGRARCLVAHPANPPYLLPIVELVPAPFTDPGVVRTARGILAAAGMSPVLIRKELEGFVFNRLQGAVLREAYRLVKEGVVTVEEADRVMREGLGRRWAVTGPFETSDLNVRGGIEVHARRLGPAYARMGAAHGEVDAWTPELVRMVTAQRRAELPLEDWEARVRWRDRALMALERARRAEGGLGRGAA